MNATLLKSTIELLQFLEARVHVKHQGMVTAQIALLREAGVELVAEVEVDKAKDEK